MSIVADVEWVELLAATALVKGEGLLLVSADQLGVAVAPLPPASTRYTTSPPPVAGLTTIVTSSVLESVPSLPVRRRTYVPATENEAEVSTRFALPNVTVPGPLNLVQVVVSVLPVGSP